MLSDKSFVSHNTFSYFDIAFNYRFVAGKLKVKSIVNDAVLATWMLTWADFTHCFGVSIVDFGQVNARWVTSNNTLNSRFVWVRQYEITSNERISKKSSKVRPSNTHFGPFFYILVGLFSSLVYFSWTFYIWDTSRGQPYSLMLITACCSSLHLMAAESLVHTWFRNPAWGSIFFFGDCLFKLKIKKDYSISKFFPYSKS